MQFNVHKNLVGLHAPFSPSQSSWLRYDDDKAILVLKKKQAAKMGTRLHEWAKETIDLGVKLPNTKKTLNRYVNDAIGFKMSTEVVLFYSERFFGTADAISFRNNFLRIHDLKTGENPASMEQLLVYAALFCLEYRVKPSNLEGCELRLYQSDEVIVDNPPAEDIEAVMDIIAHLDKLLENQMSEEV